MTAVLQVSTSDRGGGGEAVALDLHRALRARGHEVWLAVGKRRTNEEGVIALGTRRLGDHPRLERLARAARDPRVAWDFVRGREDFRWPVTRIWRALRTANSRTLGSPTAISGRPWPRPTRSSFRFRIRLNCAS